MPNAIAFVAHRSRFHLPSKPLGIEVVVPMICGLTILVDHFKLYLYYELTQLLLIYNSR